MSTFHNEAAFYVAVRKLTGPLSSVQVDTIKAISAAAQGWPVRFLAYGYATAWHEARFTPQDEWGKGKGRPYAAKGKYGQAQYGRGLVQLTWDGNYEWADKALGLKGALLKDFNLANRTDIAAAILVKGMEGGHFTGKKLADYITPGGDSLEYVRARRIINGTDKAAQIADYAVDLESAIIAGGWA